jgi:hypothetical protein
MPFVPLPDGLQIEVLHTLFEQPLECTFTFAKRPFVGTPTLEGAAAAVFFWWRDRMLPLLSRDLQWIGLAGTDISTAGGERVVIPFESPLSGGYTAGALSANVSVRVNYIVAHPPGRRRGCMFLPGIPSDQVSVNRLDLGWRAAVSVGASYLIDAAALENWRWVVSSKWSGGVLRSSAVPYRVDITYVDSLFVAQRRMRLRNQVYT